MKRVCKFVRWFVWWFVHEMTDEERERDAARAAVIIISLIVTVLLGLTFDHFVPGVAEKALDAARRQRYHNAMAHERAARRVVAQQQAPK